MKKYLLCRMRFTYLFLVCWKQSFIPVLCVDVEASDKSAMYGTNTEPSILDIKHYMDISLRDQTIFCSVVALCYQTQDV